MSKGWYVKVDTQVVFNVDTNIGVVAETEEKARLEAQKIVSERLDRHGYKDVLEKGLPCDIEMAVLFGIAERKPRILISTPCKYGLLHKILTLIQTQRR